MKSNVRTALLYTRVSTDEQADHGFSLAHQKEALERYCELHSIIALKHYREDCSGKDFNRPAFKEMFRYIEENKDQVDAILFTRWDRFSRNLEESLKYKRIINAMGVELMGIDQALDPTVPESKMMLAVLNVMAEIERDKISIRTREGMRRAMKEGYFTNRAPIGYLTIKINGGKPSLAYGELAPVIRAMFEDYSKGIYTVEDIRKKYYKKGVKRCYQGMMDILTNITYTGKIKIKEWNGEEAKVVQGFHEPIVDEVLFERVQTIMNGKKWRMNRQMEHNDDFPLRHHLKCKRCGRNLTGSRNRSRNQSVYFYYHCQDECKERFRVDKAHKDFEAFIQSMVIKPEIKEAYWKMMEKVFNEREGERGRKIQALEKQIENSREMITSVEDKYFRNLIDDPTYQKVKARYEDELTEQQQELKRLKEVETGYMKYLKKALTLLENLDRYWKELPREEKQKLLYELFPGKLIYDNGKFVNQSEDGIGLLVEDIRGAKIF